MNSAAQKWIDNAETGIARRRPGYVLKSSMELRALGEIDEATNVLRRSIRSKDFFASLDDSTRGKFLTLLCSLVKDDNPSEVLEIADALPVMDPGVLLLKATALGRLDRHAEAIALLEGECETESDPPKYDLAYKLAGLYMQVGNESAAVDLLAPLVVGGPYEDYLLMRQMLASAYIKTRRPDKALELLEGFQDTQSREIAKKAEAVTGGTGRQHNTTGKPRVFVVYGHDPSYRELELLLHRIGAEPLVFDQLPKRGGATVIEILEEYIPSADAVIVLLTPDDEGRKRGTEPWELRARQNVLIEAGYAVIARRGRIVIVALGGVSIPSDFDGIHRVQESAWTPNVAAKVAKRLLDMNLRVDAAKAS
jgi:predicted nucleotide-binding protein